MLGNGDCTFTTVPAHESGFVVPGDATAICTSDVDQDGRLEILVATNDGPLHVFSQHESQSKNKTIKVIENF